MSQRIYVRRVVFYLALLLAAVHQVSAHEKWFHETDPYPLRWDLYFRLLPLAFTAAVLLVTLAAWFWWKRRGRSFVPGPENFGTTAERRAALYGLVPAILAVHVAVPLLVSGVQGNLFTPNNRLPGVSVYVLGLAQTGIALALFYGGLARVGAAALAVLWVVGIFLVGLEQMLESAMYLGFAAFFFLAGRGPIAIDRLILPRFEPSAQLMLKAIPALRTGLGLSLVVVAFTEKFANIPLALAFLERYPLNFTSALGIPMSNETFILCAGSVELLVGLWILFGLFTREIILIAWIPINMTLTIFNWTELIGHLPIYGTLAVLLVWAPGHENLALWLSGLREGPLAILERDGQQAADAERVKSSVPPIIRGARSV
ncbi:MAG: DoxX protein [Pyrinomonadaceae bacterium]|nr:DoxX protein [Pyrinomonadaceae bacterium]